MAVDINDDNSLNEKAVNLWEKNKKNIIFGLVVFVAIYFSLNFYLSSQNKSKFLASEIYQKIQLELQEGDIDQYVSTLKNDFKNSPYAGRASLLMAHAFLEKNKIDAAIDEYDWAVNNSIEAPIKSIALYSMGKLYILKNELDLAENTANLITSKGFDGLKNYLLGDIYALRKDNVKAKSFYESAFIFYSKKNDLSKVIKTKIDAIGN
jgi:predicted negative regulator of RcsB-dependent stress response